MRYITLDEAVAQCLSLHENPEPIQEVLFRNWVVNALEILGPETSDRRKIILPLDQGVAAKPFGYLYPINMDVLHGNESVTFSFQGGADTLMGEYKQGIRVSDQGPSFVVEGIADALLLEYFSAPLDAQGNLLINELDMEALYAYTDYMWQRRKKANQNAIYEAKRTWIEERSSTRGRKNTPNMLMAKHMADSLNSILLAYKRK
jgi:hypothetical protein